MFSTQQKNGFLSIKNRGRGKTQQRLFRWDTVTSLGWSHHPKLLQESEALGLDFASEKVNRNETTRGWGKRPDVEQIESLGELPEGRVIANDLNLNCWTCWKVGRQVEVSKFLKWWRGRCSDDKMVRFVLGVFLLNVEDCHFCRGFTAFMQLSLFASSARPPTKV